MFVTTLVQSFEIENSLQLAGHLLKSLRLEVFLRRRMKHKFPFRHLPRNPPIPRKPALVLLYSIFRNSDYTQQKIIAGSKAGHSAVVSDRGTLMQTGAS